MSALEVSKRVSVPSCGRETKESQGERAGALAGGKEGGRRRVEGWQGRL